MFFEPSINISTGEGSILEPIIVNGSISFVIVKNGGSGYSSRPDILITDPDGGVGAVLKPIVNSSGAIESVSIVYGGIGYGKNTSITWFSRRKWKIILRAELQKWNINLFERNKNNITNDDRIFTESNDFELGIGYGSLYAPRKIKISSNYKCW